LSSPFAWTLFFCLAIGMQSESGREIQPLEQVVKKSLRLSRKGEYPIMDLLRLVRCAAIVAALPQHHGNVCRAARILGVHRNYITTWVGIAHEEGVHNALGREIRPL
jgi:hypothetical protein